MQLSKWTISDRENPDVPLGIVTFVGALNCGSGNVQITAENEEIRSFILYYLEDPLNQRPVYIEGLGKRNGPHTTNIEQFDLSMQTLSVYFPGYVVSPAW